MKKLFFLIALTAASPAAAQMFYNSRSSFDSAKIESASETRRHPAADDSADTQEERPFEKIVAKEIQERIRADAAFIVGEPDEVICFGVARKSPKKRVPTINGFAHLGNCGSLNDTGMKEVQKQLLAAESYDMTVTKVASCMITPRLILRFRKGYDFVDMMLSGGNCPAVSFIYGGDTREFYAKPVGEWLNNFISAVSNDLEPLESKKAGDSESMFKARSIKKEEAPAEAAAPAAPLKWGRRFAPAAEQPAESLPGVPPPPQ